MSTFYQANKPQKPPLPVFLAAVILFFFCSLSAADSVGFVPDYIDGVPAGQAGTNSATDGSAAASTIAYDSHVTAQGGAHIASVDSATANAVALSSLPQTGVTKSIQPSVATAVTPSNVVPTRIIIPAGNINLPVQNPSTTNVDTLDNLLKAGPAHYINSANLGQAGNLIIFAHSSHLPVVINKMYQAFNNIPNLNAGDSITLVGSDGKSYHYNVVSVVKANVNDGVTIDTSPTLGTNLTLVTCDTLTGVSARFVLSATFIGVSNSQ